MYLLWRAVRWNRRTALSTYNYVAFKNLLLAKENISNDLDELVNVKVLLRFFACN